MSDEVTAALAQTYHGSGITGLSGFLLKSLDVKKSGHLGEKFFTCCGTQVQNGCDYFHANKFQCDGKYIPDHKYYLPNGEDNLLLIS
jgi:hypothetical protein